MKKRVWTIGGVWIVCQVLTNHWATGPLGHWSLAYADPPTNGTITLIQDTLSGGGGNSGVNPIALLSSAGQPAGGRVIAGGISLLGGYPAGGSPWPPGEQLIDVQGTINDSTAVVVVNGVAATLTGTTFLAHNILLVEGLNTITATATDPAGHVATHTIVVTLDTQPPPMPTVTEHLAVTALGTNSHLLTGTKQAGTSIWINGVEVVSCNPPTSAACQDTSWSATWPGLIEGDNILEIIAQDAAGNVSATVIITIIVDNLPPVITNLTYADINNQPLNPDPTTNFPKTNFTPVTITGEVDDSLTQVVISGVVAVRTGQHFEVAVPLVTIGLNALALTATSPHYVTNQTLDVIRGTIPLIVSVQPSTGSKPYAEAITTIQLTALDPENDPMECQIVLDGVVLVNWMSGASFPWTPSLSDLGARTLELRVRDAFGGVSAQPVGVYVVRYPVPPP